MLKKIIPFAIGLCLTFFSAGAQDFVFLNGEQLHDTTSGSTSIQSPYEMFNYIKNNTNQDFAVTWRFLDVDSTIDSAYVATHPNQWVVTGICDNINCRGAFEDWFYGAPQNSFTITAKQTSPLFMNIYVPASSPAATNIYKVEVSTPNQIDTAIFILTKDDNTGVSAIRLTDNRVSVYPNPLPSGQNLNLYVDKSLKAQKAVIYNIIGQKQLVLSLNNGKELNRFEVGRLPAGIYVIKINNAQGQTITSRKFTKQ